MDGRTESEHGPRRARGCDRRQHLDRARRPDHRRRLASTVETLINGHEEWVNGKPLFQRRAFASAVVSGGRIYAVGGRVGGVSTANHIVESWKPGDDVWRGEANTEHERASAGGGGACVAGGENAEGTVGSVECVSDRKWTTRFTMATPRHGLVAVALNGWLHLVGGGPRPGPTVNAAHEIFDVS